MPLRKLIVGDIESFIMNIFIARQANIHFLKVDSPEHVHSFLKLDYSTFGLLSGANGSLNLIRCLEEQSNAYYIVKNRENVCDSANNPVYNGLSNGIVITDSIDSEVVYAPWRTDASLSSMFCSNYEYKLKYIGANLINYSVNENDTTIDLMENDNPHNRTNIMNEIRGTDDINNISIAFQKKRSGDWFQALSTMDTDRLYVTPSGIQKLNGPVYFCTEDRVAAVYAFALGINTIYVQRGTNIHLVYNQSSHLHINPFKMTSFNSAETITYRAILDDAIRTYNAMIGDLRHALSTAPESDDDILQYIAYIYDVVLLTNRFGGTLEEHRDLLERFIMNPLASFNEQELNTIYKCYYSASIDLEKIKSHNIHSFPRFPCFRTITPISISGIVGPSELYINGLLSDFIRTRQLPAFVKTAIHTCVASILSKSQPSAELEDHYGHLMAVPTMHMGGFIKTKPHYTGPYTLRLGKTYLDYLYSHTDGTRQYNILEVGKFTIRCASSYSSVYNKLKCIVENTGFLKSEFHEYQQYVADKNRKEQEEEDLRNSQSSPELDAFITMIVGKTNAASAI